MTHLFYRQAALAPDAPALFTVGQNMSYGELARLVSYLRVQIRESGAGPRVGILTGDDVLTYGAILAILSEGRAYVPLNAHHPAERHAAIISDADLEVVLTSRSDGALTSAIRQANIEKPSRSIRLVQLSMGEVLGMYPPVAPDPASMAYMLFTSGSTGRPKGVPIHHAQLGAFLEMKMNSGVYDFGPKDRFLQMFELTFDLSVMSFLLPLCIGASVAVMPREGILYMNLIETLEVQQVTVALMVPSVLAYLQPYFDEVNLPSLRWSLFCGEALPHSLALGWSKCAPNAKIENVYGPTEATIYCTRYPWEAAMSQVESENGVVPIGEPLPGMFCGIGQIDDPNGTMLPDGVKGELLLWGPQVTSGYWQSIKKTEEAFHSWPHIYTEGLVYRTGDLAYRNPRGQYIYCGRLDNQVKVDGYRVELGEIEHQIREFTGTLCAVVAVPSGSNFTLHAYIERLEETRLSELKARLAEYLPSYMLPRTYTLMKNLPLNSNGKIDRPVLRAMVDA
jgi:D-alanine--poly(phosphoribitol) ligase subunit 1